MTTKKAYELESRLGRYIGFTAETRHTCEQIARAATTLDRLNEEDANGHPYNGNAAIPIAAVNAAQERWERRIERDTQRVTLRLEALVASLPSPDDGKWALGIQGDPRGAAVTIFAPDGCHIYVV